MEKKKKKLKKKLNLPSASLLTPGKEGVCRAPDFAHSANPHSYTPHPAAHSHTRTPTRATHAHRHTRPRPPPAPPAPGRQN